MYSNISAIKLVDTLDMVAREEGKVHGYAGASDESFHFCWLLNDKKEELGSHQNDRGLTRKAYYQKQDDSVTVALPCRMLHRKHQYLTGGFVPSVFLDNFI